MCQIERNPIPKFNFEMLLFYLAQGLSFLLWLYCMYRAAQLITTGKYFPFLKGTYSLDFACSFFCFCFAFTWNLPPLPLAQTKMLPSPRLPLLAPSSAHKRWKNQLIVATISVCMSSVPFIVPDSRLWS